MIQNIKNLILKYGAVHFSFLVVDKFWTTNNQICYHPGVNMDNYNKTLNSIRGGHAVVIVGWKTFTTDTWDIPSGSYWIIRNSWSNNVHTDGYFYFRMYDKDKVDDTINFYLERFVSVKTIKQ